MRHSQNLPAYLIIAIGLLFLSTRQGHAQVQLIHFPVATATEHQAIELTVRLESATARIRFVRIYYRSAGDDSYEHVDMQPGIDQWVGTIPARAVQGDRLQYFVSAFLQNQTVLTYPATNPYNEPEEITIILATTESKPDSVQQTEPKKDVPDVSGQQTPTSGSILILSPENGAVLQPTDVVFAASFETNTDAVDTSSVRLTLNDRDITKLAEISEFMATITPGRLRPGSYAFKVTATTTNGIPLQPATVHFTISGEAEAIKPTNVAGHIFADVRRETIAEQDESFAMAGATINGQHNEIEYDGDVFLTSLEDRHYQPRDRFSLGLTHRYFEFRIGDMYPRFNDLMMWGKRVRGVSGALTFGAVNIQTVLGETYRAVEGRTSDVSGQTMISRFGTFRQTLFGIRPSFGNGEPVQFGFSFIKIKDDKNSIQHGINPKDNLVIGPDLRVSLDKGRTEIRAAAAFSMLTNNIESGSLTEKDIKDITGSDDDIPFNPESFETYLILNETTVPLDPRQLTSLAFHVQVKLNYFRNLLRIGYKSIGADYFSLANIWMRKDIRGFYASNRVRLLKNKLFLTLGLDRYRDNFSDTASNPSTDLNTYNATVGYFPGHKWPYINISVRDYHRDNGITALRVDSLYFSGILDSTIVTDRREDSRHRDVSLQLGYGFSLSGLQNNLSLGYVTATKHDQYDAQRTNTYISQELSTDMQMATLTTRYPVPLRTVLNFSTNENSIAGGRSEFQYHALGLSGEYSSLNGKLVTFTEFRNMQAKGQSIGAEHIDYTRNHIRIGSTYYFNGMNTLTLDGNIITLDTQASGSQAAGSYTDYIIRLRFDKYF